MRLIEAISRVAKLLKIIDSANNAGQSIIKLMHPNNRGNSSVVYMNEI